MMEKVQFPQFQQFDKNFIEANRFSLRNIMSIIFSQKKKKKIIEDKLLLILI